MQSPTREIKRNDHQWKLLRRKYSHFCRSINAPCHLCIKRGDIEHAQIDYAAPRLAPLALEVDHIKSWDDYPELRLEWNNLAPAHSRCNRQRGKRAIEVVAPQADWVIPDW